MTEYAVLGQRLIEVKLYDTTPLETIIGAGGPIMAG